MMLGFWFILVASIVVTWPSLSNWKPSIYLSYSPKKHSKLWREITCFVFIKKSSEILFYLILFSPGIYLFKFWLKRSKRVYFFIFLKWHKFFKLIETTSSFSKASILINKAHLVLMLSRGLHITCKTYYNLSIKTENYQLD